MDEKLIEHIVKLRPVLDVHGKWLSLRNEKTATNSIFRGCLRNRAIFSHRGLRNWSVVWNELFVPRLDDVFMFTFTRNPWDRVVSAFFYLKKSERITPEVGFKDYVKNILRKDWPNVKVQFHEQAPSFLFNGKPFGVWIGTFEDLKREWRFVATQINAPKDLPHLNAINRRDYKQYYDNECVEVIRKLYKAEIDFLGYEF